MLEFAAVIGAFFLYLLVLPLAGMVGAIFCRVFLPYLLGSGVVYVLLLALFGHLSAGLLLMFSIIIWSVPAVCVRYWRHSEAANLGWQEGHYRAHFALLTCGLFSRGRQAVHPVYPFTSNRSKWKAG